MTGLILEWIERAARHQDSSQNLGFRSENTQTDTAKVYQITIGLFCFIMQFI
jgi:hypothetical protein